MKNNSVRKLFCLCLCAVCASCSDSARIAKLEEENRSLKNDIKDIYELINFQTDKASNNFNLWLDDQKQYHAEIEACTNALGVAASNQIALIALVQEHIDNAKAWEATNVHHYTNYYHVPVPVPVVAQKTPPSEKMKNGLPAEIFSLIQAKAVKEWPGDFRMQAYEIKKQTDAYLSLQK